MPPFLTILLGLLFASISSAGESLWAGRENGTDLRELRGLSAEFSSSEQGSVLRLTASEPTRQKYAWATIPAPKEEGWDLAGRQTVESRITNRGGKPVQAMLWMVGRRGWSGVGDFATLEPGESRRFAVDLRKTYPDGTPKIDPSQIGQMRIMFQQLEPGSSVEIREAKAAGEAPDWIRPSARLEVPDMEAGAPAAGRRVRFQLSGDQTGEIYCALFLPDDWRPGKRYPVIAEYPGNIFFNAKCYSTGRPEHCVIGYGMSEGRGAIWLSLPFVDRDAGTVVEDGFGNADDTAEYAIQAVDAVVEKFGGDRKNLILTGFSRGAIACGYIGLRNERIAGLWKGFHACQHYDGSRWHESNMEGAIERAPRFMGRAIFQTDNAREKYQPVVDATAPAVNWTWETSKLGFHATAMFLDDRPSTRRLRRWYRELIATP